MDRDVAIKILRPNQARDASVAERFDREARAMAAVRHPAIVSIYDVEPADPPSRPEPFFVMELCEGGSLADMIASAGVIPPDDLVPIIIAVAGGLAELHGRGVVHRDVKPHNILLASDGARLGDLGVAQTDAVDADALTSTGATVGTLAYLAPEVLAGGPATPASDVYGLAVSTYQALTGRLPRPTANLADLVESRSSPITPPSIVAPVLGDAFDAPLQAAMAPDPSRPAGRARAGRGADVESRPMVARPVAAHGGACARARARRRCDDHPGDPDRRRTGANRGAAGRSSGAERVGHRRRAGAAGRGCRGARGIAVDARREPGRPARARSGRVAGRLDAALAGALAVRRRYGAGAAVCFTRAHPDARSFAFVGPARRRPHRNPRRPGGDRRREGWARRTEGQGGE